MLDELARAIARHGRPLWCETAVPRLGLVTLDVPTGPTEVLYEPTVCFVACGAKRTAAGDRDWVTDRGDMYLSSLDVPVTATFDRVPYRSAVLRIDRRVLANLLLELDDPAPCDRAHPGGVITARMPPTLVDAVARWVRLLDSPADIRPLAGRIEDEILYRLLGTPVGPVLRQFALADSRVAQVRAAAGWIRAHYTEPLTVEAVAAGARMSAAVLHRDFKTATGMSPLQFQKRLRLQEARRRLGAGDAPTALVAEAVGYATESQFNREYRRAYGVPPARDAGRRRSGTVPQH